jgi:predicted Zn-dependent protease
MRRVMMILLVAFIFSCAKVPLTGRRQFVAIPVAQMVSLGNQNYEQVLQQSKLSTNQSYIDQVKRVGAKITTAVEKYMRDNKLEDKIKGYNWEYNVIQSNEINAWCMPGGKIAFYEAIMPVCQDDNGVAVVMGHEISHAIANHGDERMSQELLVQLGGLALSEALAKKPQETQQLAMAAFGLGSSVGFILPYSRTHESEADELGLYFMTMAGYDPNGAPKFWERMIASSKGQSPPEFLSTHPDPKNRIKHLQKLIPKVMKYYKKNG